MLIKRKEKMEKGKYIDIRRLMKFFPNQMCYIIVGGRGDGKSTSGDFFVKNKIKKNPESKILYLTRYEDEIDMKKHKIAQRFGFTIERGNNFYIKEYEEYVTKNGSIKRKLIESRWVGEIISLNGSSKLRSGTDYVKEHFDLIIWDEFIDENGKELSDEFGKLKSIIETVFRTRTDALCICISNEVRPENALQKGLDINMRDLQPGSVFIDKEQKVVYYRTKTSEELLKEKRESDSYRFGKNSDYNKFAFENIWKDDNNTNVLPNPDAVMRPIYNFMYAGDLFGMYNIRNNWYISDTPSNAKTYALTRNDATMSGLQYSAPDFVINHINGSLAKGIMYFNAISTKEKIAALVGRFK